MKYRPEIDGLRAVAVVPIVLYHAGLTGFSAGFIGVDVFFVISGFLITGILINDLTNQNFSAARFYERRVRRIFPALFLVMLLCIPFAWLWMLPDDLENMGQSIVATLFFANNVLLTMTTGYWDLAGEFKPLLHTWSLGVEEQYYLFFPLLLSGVFLWARKYMVAILVFLALLSFFLFLSPHFLDLTPRQSAAIFYNLPTRAWQLLLGGIAAILLYQRDRAIPARLAANLSVLGLVMVLLALFVPMPDELNISLRTLVGTIGTTFLVAFASGENFSGRLLGNRLFVLIGLISYSVYLFHQPLIAFTRIHVAEKPGALLAIPVVLTFVLATLSYRFVEQPFRKREAVSTRLLAGILGVVGAILLAFGFAAHMTSGFPQRAGGQAAGQENLSESSIAYNQRAYAYQTAAFPEGDGPNVLVLGNSFGRDMVNVLLEGAPDKPLNIVYRSDNYDCFDENQDSVFQHLLGEADIVIMASSELPSEQCVADDIALVTGRGGRIIYVGTKHFGYNLNWIMRLPIAQRANLTNALMEETLAHERTMAAMIPEAHYISILDAIATDGRVPITDARGRILSPDRTHLTRAGAEFVANRLDLDFLWREGN